MGKRWNRKIRDVNLVDYNRWLDGMTEDMEKTHKIGDSKSIFKIVQLMSGLMVAASPQAPKVDKKGELILDHDKLASVWREFLEGKFKVTECEHTRHLHRQTKARMGT